MVRIISGDDHIDTDGTPPTIHEQLIVLEHEFNQVTKAINGMPRTYQRQQLWLRQQDLRVQIRKLKMKRDAK